MGGWPPIGNPKDGLTTPEVPRVGPVRSSRGVAATLDAIVGSQDHPQQATGVAVTTPESHRGWS